MLSLMDAIQNRDLWRLQLSAMEHDVVHCEGTEHQPEDSVPGLPTAVDKDHRSM